MRQVTMEIVKAAKAMVEEPVQDMEEEVAVEAVVGVIDSHKPAEEVVDPQQ